MFVIILSGIMKDDIRGICAVNYGSEHEHAVRIMFRGEGVRVIYRCVQFRPNDRNWTETQWDLKLMLGSDFDHMEMM
jgi:hypothetical protein